jgi:hypothetical protein
LNILVKLKEQKELNGLSLAGVGKNHTKHIQISFLTMILLNVMVVKQL